MKSNPFSTRFVAPGRIDWVSEPHHQIDNLTFRFLFDLSSRAAIVGPHGSGKSTLLEHLVPALGSVVAKSQPGLPLTQSELSEAQETVRTLSEFGEPGHRHIVWLHLRGYQNAWRSAWATRSLWLGHGILVIDGYEQLLPWRRLQIVLKTNRVKCGLLITSHRPTLLPVLHRTQMTMSIAKQVLHQLLPDDSTDRSRFLEERRLHALLAAHNGNFREVLMQMYDDVECKNLLAGEQPTACNPPLRRPK